MGGLMLVGQRWYTGHHSDDLNRTFDWDDDTIRMKCIQGSARLHKALSQAGYHIHLMRKCGRDKYDIPQITITACKTMAEVMEAICLKYAISPGAMRGPARSEILIEARREAWWYCSTVLGKSTTQIGKFFNRDHSSVVAQLKIMREALGGNNANAHAKLATVHERPMASLQGA